MDLSALLAQKPKIINHNKRKVSLYFTVEQLDLEFSNHEKRTYERLSGGNGAILAVPFDGTHFFMTSEYACGFERYELGFVKGKIDLGENPIDACNRELQEEIGYSAQKIELLKNEMTVAPGMLSLKMHTFLCTNLIKHQIFSGDEPEPIQIIRVTPQEALDLVFDKDSVLTESRSIACLTLALRRLGFL